MKITLKNKSSTNNPCSCGWNAQSSNSWLLIWRWGSGCTLIRNMAKPPVNGCIWSGQTTTFYAGLNFINFLILSITFQQCEQLYATDTVTRISEKKRNNRLRKTEFCKLHAWANHLTTTWKLSYLNFKEHISDKSRLMAYFDTFKSQNHNCLESFLQNGFTATLYSAFFKT